MLSPREHIKLLQQEKPQPAQTARPTIDVFRTALRALHMLHQPTQAAEARVAVRIRALESIHVMKRTAQMLIQHIQTVESRFAVVDGTDPRARIRIIVIVVVSDSKPDVGAVQVADELCDREVAVFGEAEDELVEGLPVGGAFARFPREIQLGVGNDVAYLGLLVRASAEEMEGAALQVLKECGV